MKIKITALLTLVFLLVLSGCRKEEYRFEQTPNQEPLVKTSVVANLMQRTALKDGSHDNIIDQASCFTVKLPVDLVVNGNPVTINTPDDYNAIKAIFDESDSDDDTLVISYPITIILENFTEVIINSESELNTYKNMCGDENEEDEDIECIDFDYPITFTTYNTLLDKLNTISIDSDKALYEFINDIEDYLIVNIEFPITLTLFDGTFVTINNLDELQLEIENVVNECDEDDDFNFEDDDDNQAEEDFIALITQCEWTIYELEINEQHQESQFDGYTFIFYEDGTATATNSTGTIYTGVWGTTLSSGLRFTIQFDEFSIISHTWRLKEINPEDDGTQIDFKYGEDEMKLKQTCP